MDELKKLTKEQLIETIAHMTKSFEDKLVEKQTEIEEHKETIERMKTEVDVANTEAAKLSENLRLQNARNKETEKTLVNSINSLKVSINQTMQMMDALGIGGNKNV